MVCEIPVLYLDEVDGGMVLTGFVCLAIFGMPLSSDSMVRQRIEPVSCFF
jgi:hypothetical protein